MASIWGLFKVEVIGPESDPYLTRVHLTPKWLPLPWGVYLHIFHRPDAEPHLHDHPRRLKSLVLKGGYIEERGELVLALDEKGAVRLPSRFMLKKRILKRIVGAWIDIPLDTKHRVVSLLHAPTVTLVFYRKNKERVWGFWVEQPDGEVRFVNSETYFEKHA